MPIEIPILFADVLPWMVGAVAVAVFVVVVLAIVINYFGIWFQAYMSSANVSLLSLIGMSFRRVNARIIVQGKIMAVQAGVVQDSHTGVTTRRLEAHYLAGGSVPNVIKAIIAAHRADIDLDFDRAAAIDLAGRDDAAYILGTFSRTAHEDEDGMFGSVGGVLATYDRLGVAAGG